MKKRSKKYQEAVKMIEKNKVYSLTEGIELVKKTSKVNFDAAVEVHFNLNIDPKKNQVVRGTVNMPHGTGKGVRVAVFTIPAKQEEAKKAGAEIVGGEELIKEIAQKKKIDFDVAIASPEIMKEITPIAKILGQKGLMPNPKNETIVQNPAEAVKAIKKGKTTFKSDESGNVHLAIGRVSFETKKLADNFKALFEEIKRARPKDLKGSYVISIHLSTSMGPSVKINPEQ